MANAKADFDGAEMMYVEIAKIDIPVYQRALADKWAQEIADNWDPHLFRPPTLSAKTDGRYDAIDGQHTIIAAERRGHLLIKARVEKGVSYMDAAGIFIGINTKRRRPTPFDTWRASVEAGHQWALDLQDVAQAHGLEIVMGSGPTHLRCIGQARQIIETHGVRALIEALDVLTDAYNAADPENASRVERFYVLGMNDLVRKARATGKYDRAYFAKRLRSAKFNRRGVRDIRVTPESFENYLAALVEQGKIPVPALSSGMGSGPVYGRAFAIAIFGQDGARSLYT